MKIGKNFEGDLIPIISILSLFIFAIVFHKHFQLLKIASISNDNYGAIETVMEYRARVIWGLASFILFSVVILNIFLAIWIIVKNLVKPNRPIAYVLPLVTFGLIIAVAIVGNSKDFDLSGSAGNMLMDNVSKQLGIGIKSVIDRSMALCALAVILTVIAMSTVLIRSNISHLTTQEKVQELKERLSYYKTSLYCTTLFLAAGIFQVYSLYNWAIFSNSNIPDSGKSIMVETLSLGGGVVYTVVFLVMFIPVSLRLNKWSKQLAESEVKELKEPITQSKDEVAEGSNTGTEDKVISWLRHNGLYNSPSKTAANFLVLVIPILVPIVSEIIKAI